MSRPKKQADCHPTEGHFALGKCKRCYYSNRKPPSPQSKVQRSAYSAEWRKRNPEKLAGYALARDRERANQATEKWRRANPEKVKQGMRAAHMRKYQLTAAEYDRLLEEQGGVCLVCRGENIDRRLAVDHCHETGAVRGLLCTGCNFAVGWAERRGESVFDAFREYVTKALARKRMGRAA
jgi:hypothetical protein